MALQRIFRRVFLGVLGVAVLAGCATGASTASSSSSDASTSSTSDASTSSTSIQDAYTETESDDPPSIYSAPPEEERPSVTPERNGSGTGRRASVDLGGPRLGTNFSGQGEWSSDGEFPHSVSVKPATPTFKTLFLFPPADLSEVEVLDVSLSPDDQLFGTEGVQCDQLLAGSQDDAACKVGVSFAAGDSVIGESYDAELTFRLRATCPDSAGVCDDENGDEVAAGDQVTWTSVIRLSARGCGADCPEALSGLRR